MPKETNLAARNDKGEVVLYHDSDYPSPALIELLEKYNSGSTAIVLEMVRKEQENSFTINNRNSKTACTSSILCMTYVFVLTLTMILLGTFLIVKGNQVSGCITLFMGIVSIISTMAKNIKRK